MSDAAAVQAALDEFVRIGQQAFLSKYGYGNSKDFLVRNPVTGDLCDSKAIVGVACGRQNPERGSLGPADFSGGEATVAKKLRAMGFEVVRIGDDWTRDELDVIAGDYLAIVDAGACRSAVQQVLAPPEPGSAP